jgi:hypothetical protein
MSTISKCPKCHELVTIPEGVAAGAAVRCPLCRAEYALSVVLDAIPPTLIPVEPRIPPAGLGEMADAAREAAVPAEFGRTAVVAPATAGPVLQSWERLAAAADLAAAEAAPAPAETAETDLEPALFGGFAREAAEVSSEKKARRGAEVLAAPFPPRRRRRSGAKTSPLRKLVGIIGGGVLGLAIGYYLLNWIGGPRFDFLQVYLPGVPHTYRHSSESDSSPVDPPETGPNGPGDR